MAEAQKVLGQSAPPAGALTACYTAPRKAVVSSFTACNQSHSIDANIRMSVAVAGAADDSSQYIYYDLPVFAVDTFIATIGITLGAGDVLRVRSDTGQVSFNFFGVEIT